MAFGLIIWFSIVYFIKVAKLRIQYFMLSFLMKIWGISPTWVYACRFIAFLYKHFAVGAFVMTLQAILDDRFWW